MELNLQRKIGQLFMVGFDGLVANDHIRRMIQEHDVGGVILFRRNVESPEQVAKLCRDLQEMNAKVSPIPLLIAIDQEGGMVMRIERGMTPVPSAMAFQEAGSLADCEQLTKVSGEELRRIGINMNLAPVLDVNNNPMNPVIGVRSYGEDSDTVIAYGMAALRGLQKSGLVVTAKHFPGHGDTSIDSHYAMPLIAHNRQRLDAVELPPFRAAIAQGVHAIMTAHVVFPAIEPEPDLPATLSKNVLTDLLRHELGYTGVIVTDCLEMAAISEGMGVAKGAIATLRAGSDLVLISHLEERQTDAIRAVVNAVQTGVIASERIDEAMQRILQLKQISAVANWRNLPLHPEGLRGAESLALSRHVYKASLRTGNNFQALQATLPVTLITVEMQARTEVDEATNSEEDRSSMLFEMRKAGLDVREYILPFNASNEEVADALAFAKEAQQIVMQTYNAVFSAGQQQLIATFLHDKLWLVAGRLPYDLNLAPQAQGRLANFSNRPVALVSVVDKLIGRI